MTKSDFIGLVKKILSKTNWKEKQDSDHSRRPQTPCETRTNLRCVEQRHEDNDNDQFDEEPQIMDPVSCKANDE